MTLRERVRALTDALPKGAWASYAVMMTALDPRPSDSALAVTLLEMKRAKYLERRGTARHYEYRSAPREIEDLRTRGPRTPRPPAPRTKALGNVALARLQREDPAKFKRLTQHDGPGWKAGA